MAMDAAAEAQSFSWICRLCVVVAVADNAVSVVVAAFIWA